MSKKALEKDVINLYAELRRLTTRIEKIERLFESAGIPEDGSILMSEWLATASDEEKQTTFNSWSEQLKIILQKQKENTVE